VAGALSDTIASFPSSSPGERKTTHSRLRSFVRASSISTQSLTASIPSVLIPSSSSKYATGLLVTSADGADRWGDALVRHTETSAPCLPGDPARLVRHRHAHHCIGTPLARMDLQVALDIPASWPRISLGAFGYFRRPPTGIRAATRLATVSNQNGKKKKPATNHRSAQNRHHKIQRILKLLLPSAFSWCYRTLKNAEDSAGEHGGDPSCSR
jgi:hypothetical protein